MKEDRMSTAATEGLPAAPTPQSSVLAVLQRIGRSLMLPIVVLPAAALLLRFGQPYMLVKVWSHFDILATAGNALFSNLPILFAVGVAIGFARRADGSTALAALVGYVVFNGVYTSLTKELASKAVPGVLGGITIGLTAALLWQRYHRVRLVPWLAFFGGRRFVPIVMAAVGL